MARTELKDQTVAKIKLPPDGKQVEHWDALVPGLALRVSYKGTKTWMVMKRGMRDGQKKLLRHTLGQYPAMGLKKAREEARDVLQLMQDGKDIKRVEEDRQREIDAQVKSTFSAVLADFLAAKKGDLKGNTYAEYDRVLNSSDFANWQTRPISDISRREVLETMQALEKRVSSVTANKAFAFLRAFFNWAVGQLIIESAPTDRLTPPRKADARDRVLLDDELRIVWKAAPAAGLFAPMFKLLALTGQRREEIASLRWSEIRDLEGVEPFIELPKERTKNSLPHVVPLSPQAAAVLIEVRATWVGEAGFDFVFTHTGKTPASGFSRAKENLDKAIADVVAAEIAHAEDEGDTQRAERLGKLFAESWRLHDLRRTMVTGMNNMGVAPHVVEAIVNHISGASKAGVAGVYNRALYLPERRAALALWARHVARLTQPAQDGADVIDLATARQA